MSSIYRKIKTIRDIENINDIQDIRDFLHKNSILYLSFLYSITNVKNNNITLHYGDVKIGKVTETIEVEDLKITISDSIISIKKKGKEVVILLNDENEEIIKWCKIIDFEAEESRFQLYQETERRKQEREKEFEEQMRVKYDISRFKTYTDFKEHFLNNFHYCQYLRRFEEYTADSQYIFLNEYDYELTYIDYLKADIDEDEEPYEIAINNHCISYTSHGRQHTLFYSNFDKASFDIEVEKADKITMVSK